MTDRADAARPSCSCRPRVPAGAGLGAAPRLSGPRPGACCRGAPRRAAGALPRVPEPHRLPQSPERSPRPGSRGSREGRAAAEGAALQGTTQGPGEKGPPAAGGALRPAGARHLRAPEGAGRGGVRGREGPGLGRGRPAPVGVPGRCGRVARPSKTRDAKSSSGACGRCISHVTALGVFGAANVALYLEACSEPWDCPARFVRPPPPGLCAQAAERPSRVGAKSLPHTRRGPRAVRGPAGHFRGVLQLLQDTPRDTCRVI